MTSSAVTPHGLNITIITATAITITSPSPSPSPSRLPRQANGSGVVLSSRRWREVKVPSTGSRTGSGVLYRQQIPLSKLQPAAAYELYVQAKNKHGWNAVSDTLHFTTIARGEGELAYILFLTGNDTPIHMWKSI